MARAILMPTSVQKTWNESWTLILGHPHERGAQLGFKRRAEKREWIWKISLRRGSYVTQLSTYKKAPAWVRRLNLTPSTLERWVWMSPSQPIQHATHGSDHRWLRETYLVTVNCIFQRSVTATRKRVKFEYCGCILLLFWTICRLVLVSKWNFF
jgi:hypothetical protein